MVTNLVHKLGVAVVFGIVGFRYVEHVFSMQGSARISVEVSDVVAFLVLFGSNSIGHMFVCGVSFNPGKADGVGALGTNSFEEVLPKVPITSAFPRSFRFPFNLRVTRQRAAVVVGSAGVNRSPIFASVPLALAFRRTFVPGGLPVAAPCFKGIAADACKHLGGLDAII